MPTLMDVIMQEYRGQPGVPDYTLGSRRTMMQPGGQFNEAGQLGNMGLRQSLRAQGEIPQPIPASTGFFPPRAEGDTGLSTPIIQTPNRRPQIPQEVYENFQRVVDPTMRAVPTVATGMGGNYSDVINAPYTPVLAGQYNDVFNAPYMPPTVRQRPLPEVLASRDERTVAPARQPGFFERLFSGPQYQSNSIPVLAEPQGAMPVTGAPIPSYINWANAGGPEGNAADFFAADRLLMQQNPAMFGLLGGSNG